MLKITVDITPIDDRPSGVGLYVLSLIKALSQLESSESFELGLAYQPRLKNWLKGNLDFPNNFKNYKNLYQIPAPVRVTNLFIDYLPRLFPSYIESMVGNPNIVHGTNYTVYPYQNIKKV